MSQRRLIPSAALAAALALSACGSDDADAPTAGDAAQITPATSSTVISPPEPTTGGTTMTTHRPDGTDPAADDDDVDDDDVDDADASRPSITLELNPKITSPGASPSLPGDGREVPVPAEPAGDDVGRAIAHVRLLVDDPRADVELVVAEEVTWRDGAIGCPEPGMVYTQALVDGSRVVVRHEGVDYAYHRGGSRDLFWCPTAIMP